jgi:hypothetical protein
MITIPSSKKLGNKTRKNRSRLTGDIEMTAIPSPKKLGNKTQKNKLRSPLAPPPLPPPPPPPPPPQIISKQKSSVATVKSKKTEKREIYTKRVKYSKCRGLEKTVCLNKKRCMFTNGEFRKYCRKKYNKRVQL